MTAAAASLRRRSPNDKRAAAYLVEEEEGRGGDHELGQGEPGLLPAREELHLLVHGVPLEAHPPEERLDVRQVHLGPGRRLLQRHLHRLAQVQRLRLVLRKVVGDHLVVPELGVPGRGLLLPEEEADEGGLAGTVGAHHRDALAALDQEVEVVEEHLAVVPGFGAQRARESARRGTVEGCQAGW